MLGAQLWSFTRAATPTCPAPTFPSSKKLFLFLNMLSIVLGILCFSDLHGQVLLPEEKSPLPSIEMHILNAQRPRKGAIFLTTAGIFLLFSLRVHSLLFLKRLQETCRNIWDTTRGHESKAGTKHHGVRILKVNSDHPVNLPPRATDLVRAF